MRCRNTRNRFSLQGTVVGFLAAIVLQLGLANAWGGQQAVTLLHTNDIHQNLDRLAHIAAFAADYRRQHPETLLIDAGDFFDRGSSLVPLTQGEAIYAAMSLMGYDLRILGNHDWSYGDARVREFIGRYPGTVLGTNLATIHPPLPANLVRTAIKEYHGIRLGFLGLTLDSYGKAPQSRPELYVLDARQEAARAVAELKPKVDVIVAVTHLGLKPMAQESGRSCPTDVELARAHPDIRVIVGGHTHTLLPESETRDLYRQTGAIIVQAGALGKTLGRLTLQIDQESRRIERFEIEHIDTAKLYRASPEVAGYLQQQYDRYMPKANVVLGQFAQPMEFYNLAYWYADFLRAQTNADIAWVARKSLYDEPKSFPEGPVTVESLYGYVHQRYLVRGRVAGRALLDFCQSKPVRDRFHPSHHQRGPFSGDAIYCSGMTAGYRPKDGTVEFSIDPDRSYTLVVAWPFDDAAAREFRRQLPERAAVPSEMVIPGLALENPEVLPITVRELMTSVGEKDGLSFVRRYATPDPQWKPWAEKFEAELKTASP